MFIKILLVLQYLDYITKINTYILNTMISPYGKIAETIKMIGTIVPIRNEKVYDILSLSTPAYVLFHSHNP